MSLRRLPVEIVSLIVQDLSLEDIFHLGTTCRSLQWLLYDDRTCKNFVEAAAAATPEAREARQTSGSYARAFRRLAKKRQAIRAAAPFTAAIVAVAESWLYADGVLCHVQDRTLRILPLHHSAADETVVDIPSLLLHAGLASSRRKYKFRLLHHANGIVSCLYTRFRPDVQSHLVVFDFRQPRILPLSSRCLESTNKIFVRNDQNYLYCGTHSEFGDDGFRRWVLIGYDIQAGRWLDQKLHLLDMVGSDVGQSVSFDIIDGYFYGLSNQTSFEIDEVDWTSYYHCFKFPVAQPASKHSKHHTWRRQHAEGPIDDRWSFLRLVKNEQTGQLQVLEARREWLGRKSSAQRTYYTTDLHCDTTTTPPRRLHTHYTPPDSPEPARVRDPYNTHMGDDASTALLLTLSKCFVRAYYASSQAFVDLVDSCDPKRPRLRLRAGARELRPFGEVPQSSPAYDQQLPHPERIRHLYKQDGASNIIFWPPASHEASTVRADVRGLDQLDKVLNPPSHVGRVKGTWDDRSFVYATGNNPDGVQALVFLGFDSGIRLRGLAKWGGEGQQSAGSVGHEEPWVEGGERRACNTPQPEPHDDVQKCDWVWKESAMYREIGCGFNDLPDFTWRRQQAAAEYQ